MKHAFTAAAAAAALLFGAGSAFAADIPVQKLDPALNAQLPQAIKDAGVIRNCVIGSFSPYTITRADTMLGLKSGRYDVSLEPVGDYPDREVNYDFVDYVQEFVVFAVKKGNPHNIRSIADTCVLRVSVMAAGSAERVIKKQSEVCVKEGKKPVTVLSFEGQAAPTLALSRRAAL